MKTSGDFVAARLANAPVFEALPPDELARLAAEVEPMTLTAGSTLTEQGEAADGAYLLISGRLRAFSRQADGSVAAVGDIAAGELVGEMALLSSAARGATVRALRDSQLLFISAATFEGLVETSPQAMLAVARGLVARLERANASRGVASPNRAIALIAANGDCGPATAEVIAALGNVADVVIREGDKAAALGPDHSEAELVEWLNRLESEANLVVYIAEDIDSQWGHRCLRQADQIIAIDAAPGRGDVAHKIAALEAMTAGNVGPTVRVVCVHAADARRPAGAARWIRSNSIEAHHIRDGSAGDYERVARTILGQDLGVVFSGGGARGLAHVGVVRALAEADIPIDVVGGTSFGAIVAMMVALDMSWEEMRAVFRGTVGRDGAPVDLTVPAVSLSKGQRLLDMLGGFFGDNSLEHTWRRGFCVSSNLSSGHALVHTTGSIVQALRASIAIPGVFPPVASEDGEVLVDGAVMNNLPVDVMARMSNGGPIVAVNLRSPAEMEARQLPIDGVVSGWRSMGSRLWPFTPRAELPSLMTILARANEMSGADAMRALEATADYVLRPPTGGHPFLDFSAVDPLIQTGYEYTVGQLEAWRQEGRRLGG
jgi:predicted acylesterase/phospholipase RssA/CRP-like cAMP-binding protein